MGQIKNIKLHIVTDIKMSLRILCTKKLIHRSLSVRLLCSSSRMCKPAEDDDKKEENYFKDTTDFKSADIPKSALYLGFGGAIPFVSLAMASGLTSEYSNAI